MDGTRKYHSGRNNSDPKGHTWYVLTDKWILAQKPRVPKIHFPKHKKIKKEDQRMDT